MIDRADLMEWLDQKIRFESRFEPGPDYRNLTAIRALIQSAPTADANPAKVGSMVDYIKAVRAWAVDEDRESLNWMITEADKELSAIESNLPAPADASETDKGVTVSREEFLGLMGDLSSGETYSDRWDYFVGFLRSKGVEVKP